MGETVHRNRARRAVVASAVASVVILAACVVALCGMPAKAFAAHSVHLKDGDVFDLSQVKSATRVYVDTSGEFRFTGSSNKVLVDVQMSEGQYAVIYLDGVTLTPNGDAPGASYNDRSAITVKDTKNGGGEVVLASATGTTSTIKGYKNKPAIQKSGTKTKLTFATEPGYAEGTIKAYADSSAFRTCAIGAYGSQLKNVANTAGNIWFESGIVEAYGSPGGGYGGSGGAGIGADAGAYVDGITINGGSITAVAGDWSAAAIGTSSADVTYLILPAAFLPIYPRDAKNITITGGQVIAKHADGSDGEGGAGIGGGYGCTANGITISGGSVYAEGSTGIGGGSNGDGLNIKITGGDVEALGQFTGIGGGKSTGTVTESAQTWFGEATVDISGGVVKAYCTGVAGSGVGIGGWKCCVAGAENLNGNGHVNITGGRVTAKGARGLAGIGTGLCGSLDHISISGGFVYAEGGSGDGSSPAPGIGMSQDAKIAYSHIKRISISGGTVEAVAAGGANYSIGAFSNISAFGQKTAAPVYISGGNVKAELGCIVVPKQSAGGKEVSCCQLDTETYGSEQDLTNRTVSSLTVRDLTSGANEIIPYGYNDMHPFKESSAAVFYVWLPSCDTRSVELSITPATGNMRHYDKDFSGLSDNSANMLLYPRTPVQLVAANAGEPGTDGSVVLAQGRDPIDYQRAVREGRELLGYSLSPDGSDLVLDAQGKLIANAVDGSGALFADSAGRFVGSNQQRYNSDFKLYAQWRDTGGVVQFDMNKPSGVSAPVLGSVQDTNLDAGQSMQLGGDLRLPGYSFKGWNTKADGSGRAYAGGDSVAITEIGEVVTLYAQWQLSEYLICFVPNGGELESGEASFLQRAFFGLDTQLETPAMQLRARHLSGWNTDPDGTGAAYGLGETVQDIAASDQEVVYLHAQWGVDAYTVNYNGNGAEGSMDPDVLECGIAHLLPNRGFSREGYTFAGWNTLPDGSGAAFSLEGSYADLAIAGESVTLYAQWTDDNPDPGPEPEPDPDPDPAPEPNPDPAPDPDPGPGPDPAPTPDPGSGSDNGTPVSGGKGAPSTLANTGDASATVPVALAAVALACAIACALLYRRHLP